ncbi:MAG: hypothetical protein M3N13_02220 [Candidatus Eremiobacteraeota bacterium]|nr:hypothetical protein [Candidatus Eremiobacteraeota bacterium]
MRTRFIALGLSSAALLAACAGGNGDVPVSPSAFGPQTSSVSQALSGGWTSKASMQTAEFGPGSVEIRDVLYVVGGTSNGCCVYQNVVQAYDIATNTWSTKAPMPTPRNFLAVGSLNGILYAVGGFGQAGALNTVEAYDPQKNTWTAKAPMPTARAELSVRAINGTLYAVGGYALSGNRRTDNQTLVALDVVEAYNPATNTWTTKSHMNGAHAGAASAQSGTLYIVGGIDAQNNYSHVVEAYDPATDTWALKAPMPTARYDLAAGIINGTLYAVGGWGSAGVTNVVEAYNPGTNTWTAKPPMPTARYGLTVRGIDRQLYAVAGRDSSQLTLSTVESYSP